MYWADKIAKDIVASGKYKPYWVDDMKTPSGKIHIGSLRGVIIHDLVYKALQDLGESATFTYVFDDSDPMDGLPVYLDKDKWEKHMGEPLFLIPSPEEGYSSYAEFFAKDFIDVFTKVGCEPKVLWTSQLYLSGKMNDGVKLCLDNTSEIKKVYEEMYDKKLPADWYPFQVKCPSCGKLSTTKVTAWDGEKVTFKCNVDGLDWTKGCGYQGKVSPLSSKDTFAGKLPWKVEWPVKWKVIGVTIEGAGKDHMSAGGSHDVAKEICKRVVNYPVPYAIPYEFFLIGGKKMSSSKGLGSSAREVSEIMPPYLMRFLFTRTDYRQAIDFDPVGTMAIPDLFDEYDRCWAAYIDGSDANLARVFDLSQIAKKPSKEKVFLPRFRDIANYIQIPNENILNRFEEAKGEKLTAKEKKILEERTLYAKLWVEKYAPDDFAFKLTDIHQKADFVFTDRQKQYLIEVKNTLDTKRAPEELQVHLYELAKKLGIDTQDAFRALYASIIGKEFGPKAGWLILQYPKQKIVENLDKAINSSKLKSSINDLNLINKPEFFTISEEVKDVLPSVSIGIALIKGVNIKTTNPMLEKQKQEFLTSVSDLTTEQLGHYPEILSYRKLYKQMGVDWHSRRPSPEALLRRVALKKGLYNINTCVDAYNLVVMKNRVSVGAFNADAISFPTKLRFAGEGDEILLLGDDELTKFSSKELAYYDQKGGYNIDFNYRDAKRTMVTEQTKNLWINVDGIYDITPEKVEKTLNDTIDMIIKYCGGNVEFKGVVK